MLAAIRFAAVAASVGYLGVCLALFLMQRQFLYFPTPDSDADETAFFTLENHGASLKIWKVAAGNTKAAIYFGGNAETVIHNIPALSDRLPDHDIFLVNYRGYSGSTGAPSENGLLSDGLAVFDHIKPDYEQISVIGRSLGSAVAVHVAANRPVARALLITPFDSVKRIAEARFPFVPVSVLLRDKYDSAAKAPIVTAPVMIVIAERDDVIPPHHSRRLAQRFSQAPVETVVIQDADHQSVSGSPAFWIAFDRFFSSAQ